MGILEVLASAAEKKEKIDLALSFYVGDICLGCHKEMKMEDMKKAVSWPHKNGRVGHGSCHKAHGNPMGMPRR